MWCGYYQIVSYSCGIKYPFSQSAKKMKIVCCEESYQNKGCLPAFDARNNVHQKIHTLLNNNLMTF